MNLNTPRILQLPYDRKVGRLPAYWPLCLVQAMDIRHDDLATYWTVIFVCYVTVYLLCLVVPTVAFFFPM